MNVAVEQIRVSHRGSIAGHRPRGAAPATAERREDIEQRRGEARGAVIGGKLYLVTYEAPSLYYYGRSAAAAKVVADSVRF